MSMLLQEIILQTRQSLQAAVNSRWDLIERYPPVTSFKLADDLEIVELDSELAEHVMDSCEARTFGMGKPVRQSNQLYSFVRGTTAFDNIWDWKPDQSLEMCVAFSRLVHPTSFRLEYHVKVALDERGKLRELIPLVGEYRGAWIAERDRDWLAWDDFVELQKLVARLPIKLPARINRALWYNEYAARTFFADVRWTMIATALEALIHTDRYGSTAQFVARTVKLGVAMGLTGFSEDSAARFYDRRSSLAHGQGLGELRSEDQILYILGEDLLRMVLQRAILDPQFAATFKDETGIRKHWN
jgi:hypothetical protein